VRDHPDRGAGQGSDTVVHASHQQAAEIAQVTSDLEARDLALALPQEPVAVQRTFQDNMAVVGPLSLPDWVAIGAQHSGANNGLVDTFPLTQEFMAQMLGVSRSTVSITVGRLQNAGLISYVRGTITDRPGAEAVSCECYRVIRDQVDRPVGGDR
jgi:CRP-like cAMP-binding protein